ncbi:hypothetical protein MJO57_07920 [Endozoicomonas sp. SCSIO W0465]|nr:hypothetical protein [Endozoicomonas sp. SCSIO W0465]USE38092.1 hypothetical protein MJO57_07920 [Endozoicomonas sp. SCSIO W0465]
MTRKSRKVLIEATVTLANARQQGSVSWLMMPTSGRPMWITCYPWWMQ